ncbi:MAG: DegT/DnrJ/EryC1/StrS family aminotransferase [Bacteroidia bacterium]
MQPLTMVDLHGQYLNIKGEIDTAISHVLDTTAFIKGPDVKEFERSLAKYLNTKHAIGCANGTDALQLALMALELPPGAEVITPDFTFIATVEVVKLLGFRPVIVDVDPDTFTIDPARIEEAISDKTKAIIPVHLFGQCADMNAIMEIAKRHDLYVIEDTAQATGAEYTLADGSVKKAGTIGQIGCTSFFPSKNLGCFGDGGALFTDDEELAAKISQMANHGQGSAYHYDTIGVNSRLDTIQAAILNVKLPHLDRYNAARRKAADFYDSAFKNIPELITPARNQDSTHIFHQYTLKLKNTDRGALMKFLDQNNIPNKVYYPFPLHKQQPYQDARFDTQKLEVSKSLCQSVISLPMHTELSEQQLEYIAKTVNKFFNQ